MTMPINVVKLPSILEGHARKIKKLMEQWTANTIDIGKELTEAQANFPIVKGRGAQFSRPGWDNWVKINTGISLPHARTLMQIAKKFGECMPSTKISYRVLMLLSREATPEPARREVIERIERGEKIGHKETSKVIKEHKFPKPTEANKQAKETGQPVQASDGNIYFGTSKADAQAGEDRRTIVYGVRDAIETLSDVNGMSPLNFLKYMLPHQRWNREDAKQIEKARLWLNELAEEWSNWKDK